MHNKLCTSVDIQLRREILTQRFGCTKKWGEKHPTQKLNQLNERQLLRNHFWARDQQNRDPCRFYVGLQRFQHLVNFWVGMNQCMVDLWPTLLTGTLGSFHTQSNWGLIVSGHHSADWSVSTDQLPAFWWVHETDIFEKGMTWTQQSTT